MTVRLGGTGHSAHIDAHFLRLKQPCVCSNLVYKGSDGALGSCCKAVQRHSVGLFVLVSVPAGWFDVRVVV